jgi:hypothetical protein
VAERIRVFLDLCSGLGGASRAFVVHPNTWRVIRVDNDPQFASVPHTRTLDVLEWMDWIDSIPVPEVIWASVPCTEFSLAANAHRPRPENPDLRILEAVRAIIDHFRPRIWVIENVAGACRYFEPILGHHFQSIGPFFLWGRCPYLVVPRTFTHSKTKGELAKTTNAALRAQIPLEISRALWESVVNQQTLEGFQ